MYVLYIHIYVELGRVLMSLFLIDVVSLSVENLKEALFIFLRQVIKIRYTIFLFSNHTALTLINNVHINCRELALVISKS